jgi:hypothetical protein
MKSSIALPCFVKDSLGDVLFLNRCSLDFKLDCVIVESEKGRYLNTLSSASNHDLVPKSLPDIQSV